MVEKVDLWYGLEMLLCLLLLPGTDVGCRLRSLLRRIEYQSKIEGPAESYVCTVTDECTMSPGSPHLVTIKQHIYCVASHTHMGNHTETAHVFSCFSQRPLTVEVVRGLCRTHDGKHM